MRVQAQTAIKTTIIFSQHTCIVQYGTAREAATDDDIITAAIYYKPYIY